MTVSTRTILVLVVLILGVRSAPAAARGPSGNLAPHIAVVWPKPGDSFGSTTVIKIKAGGFDPDGSISRVDFFADTNLIGTVTNPPFNIIWFVNLPGEQYREFTLKAIAVDNSGNSTESRPVSLNQHQDPPAPILEVISPRNGAVLSAPASFAFAAETLASAGDTGPVEFFIGPNSVGLVDSGTTLTATTPPSSITVSNLHEGEYKLTVRYRGLNGDFCPCIRQTNTIRVAKLGVQSPRLSPNGQFQFEIVTSFPGIDTVTQASADLTDWIPISTNRPASSTFIFTENSPATNNHRFYRVVLPSEQP